MRKAKVAAIIFGSVTTTLFGGLFGVYATSPVVSSVTPKKDVENICEVKNEELSNIAAVTSISTTAVTTTSKSPVTTTTKAYTTTAAVTTTANIAYYTAPAAATSTAATTTADTVTFDYSDHATAAVFTAAANTETTTAEEVVYVVDVTTTAVDQFYCYNEPVSEDDYNTYEPMTAPVTETVAVETVTTTTTAPAAPAPTPTSTLPISDSDYIILCNAVAHEAGCNWIDEYDKAKVVEVIMNRVNSPLYPNTITGVLTQPYQFSGSSSYVYLGTYTSYVTQSVKDAVTLYFTEPESFNHGYFSFYGDGYRNYFS